MSIYDEPAHCERVALKTGKTVSGAWMLWCAKCGAYAIHRENSNASIGWSLPTIAGAQTPEPFEEGRISADCENIDEHDKGEK